MVAERQISVLSGLVSSGIKPENKMWQSSNVSALIRGIMRYRKNVRYNAKDTHIFTYSNVIWTAARRHFAPIVCW